MPTQGVSEMAYISNMTLPASLRQSVDVMLSRLSDRLEAYANRRARRAEIEYLESLGDAELAARGIERDDIVRHVFRDRLLSL